MRGQEQAELRFGEEDMFGRLTGGFLEHVCDVEEEKGMLWVLAIGEWLLDAVVELGLG
jgi:hypothetical protein